MDPDYRPDSVGCACADPGGSVGGMGGGGVRGRGRPQMPETTRRGVRGVFQMRHWKGHGAGSKKAVAGELTTCQG